MSPTDAKALALAGVIFQQDLQEGKADALVQKLLEHVKKQYVTHGAHAAAVKAAVSLNDDGMRPLARGPAIRVGRAYGAEDEDCTLVLKPSTDERGRVRYMRSVTCAN